MGGDTEFLHLKCSTQLNSLEHTDPKEPSIPFQSCFMCFNKKGKLSALLNIFFLTHIFHSRFLISLFLLQVPLDAAEAQGVCPAAAHLKGCVLVRASRAARIAPGKSLQGKLSPCIPSLTPRSRQEQSLRQGLGQGPGLRQEHSGGSWAALPRPAPTPPAGGRAEEAGPRCPGGAVLPGPAVSCPAEALPPPGMMPVIYCAAQHGLSPGLGVPFQRRPRVLEAVAPRGLRQPRRSRPLSRTGASRAHAAGTRGASPLVTCSPSPGFPPSIGIAQFWEHL